MSQAMGEEGCPVAKQGEGKVRGRQDLDVVNPRLAFSQPIVHGWPQKRSAFCY